MRKLLQAEVKIVSAKKIKMVKVVRVHH